MVIVIVSFSVVNKRLRAKAALTARAGSLAVAMVSGNGRLFASNDRSTDWEGNVTLAHTESK